MEQNFVIDYTSPLNDIMMIYGDHYQVQRYTNGIDRISMDMWMLDDHDNGWIPGGTGTNLSGTPEKLYYLQDELGSTTKLIGEDGKTSAHYNYDEFGRPLSFKKFDQNWPGPDNTFGYTGYQYDAAAGLYYAQARYYRPEIGRFISTDPWPGELTQPLTLNPYPYVQNNPMIYVDPLGLFPADYRQFEYNQLQQQASSNTSKQANSSNRTTKPKTKVLRTIQKTTEQIEKDLTQSNFACTLKNYLKIMDKYYTQYNNWVSAPYVESAKENLRIRGITENSPNYSQELQREVTMLTMAFGVCGGTTGNLGSKAGNVLKNAAADAIKGAGKASTTKYVNLASEGRTKHILFGDATGGGHIWPGAPSKTPFPKGWSGDKIMNEVSDIVTDPNLKWVENRVVKGVQRYEVIGTRDGVKIKVVTDGKDIITAFPVK